MADLADIKAASRRALHQRMAVPALYSAPGSSATRAITVRWHNKMQPTIGIADGGAGVLEGIEKLVFNQSQLAAPSDLGAAIELERGARVQIPKYGITVTLDSMGASDGPENIYWMVTSDWE